MSLLQCQPSKQLGWFLLTPQKKPVFLLISFLVHTLQLKILVIFSDQCPRLFSVMVLSSSRELWMLVYIPYYLLCFTLKFKDCQLDGTFINDFIRLSLNVRYLYSFEWITSTKFMCSILWCRAYGKLPSCTRVWSYEETTAFGRFGQSHSCIDYR